MAVLIYVDDVIVAGDDLARITALKSYLDHQFKIKNLGPLKYFLGIEVARSSAGMVLNQRKYVLDILMECELLGCRPASSPMDQKVRFSEFDPLLDDPAFYRRIVGRLLYLTVTRPDICFAVNTLSQFMHAPRKCHLDAVFHLLRYLKQAPGQGLFLSATASLSLTAYCDADWAGCPITRRSTTGYMVFLGSALVSWRSKKQPVVSRSSAEAEYRAMAHTTSELVWLRTLLGDLGISTSAPIPLHCDNQAALHIVANPVFHERTKHIEIDCHFVRQHYSAGLIIPRKIPGAQQLADGFTKPLGPDRFRLFLSKLGMLNIHAPT